MDGKRRGEHWGGREALRGGTAPIAPQGSALWGPRQAEGGSQL